MVNRCEASMNQADNRFGRKLRTCRTLGLSDVFRVDHIFEEIEEIFHLIVFKTFSRCCESNHSLYQPLFIISVGSWTCTQLRDMSSTLLCFAFGTSAICSGPSYHSPLDLVEWNVSFSPIEPDTDRNIT